MKILIVGAGPIGCYVGRLLALAGFDVLICDKRESLLREKCCTGLVTRRIFEFVDVEPFVLNKFSKARLICGDLRNSLRVDDYLIDRKRFDFFMLREAVDAGVRIFLRHEFAGIKDGKALFLNNGRLVSYAFDCLIGADGVNSGVAKMLGVRRRFFYALQGKAFGEFNLNEYKVYFGDFAPDFFGWIVPENSKIARIGMATRCDLKERFRKFLSMVGHIIDDLTELKFGMIPIYAGQRCEFEVLNKRGEGKKVYLVGDAACQVKNTTGGGIVPGLWAGRMLVEAIKGGISYEKLLKKKGIRKFLKKHALVRKLIDFVPKGIVVKNVRLFSRKLETRDF